MPEYTSCFSIEEGLSFHDTNLLYCTTINSVNGLGRPVIKSNYKGELIDWEEFFKIRNEHRKLFQSGGCLKECENCPLLHQNDWQQKDELSYILLCTWKKCNSYCLYCCTDDKRDILNEIWTKTDVEVEDSYNIVPVLTDMVEKKILRKDAVIDFAGGEPTLYSRFNEIMNLFVENDYTNIIVHTNAINYSKAIEVGISKGLVSLLVSVDAGSRKIHEKIKRVPSYDIVWGNLKSYFSARKEGSTNKLRTKYIVMPGVNDSLSEIDTWLIKSKEIGVTGVAWNADQFYVNDNSEDISVLLQIVHLTNYFIDKANELGLEWELYPSVRQAHVLCGLSCPYSSSCS